MIAELVRYEERRERFGEACHVLSHIDQGDRQVARCMENANSKGADQHDVAGCRRSALPQEDGPCEQPDGQKDGDHGMQQPKFLEVEKAPLAGGHFVADRFVEPAVLAAQPAKGTNQRHIGNDVDHLSVDRGCLVGKIVMQRLACVGKAEQGDNQEGRD